VDFQCCSIFAAALPGERYDLVYDSGCFHHLPPHRRQDYVALVGVPVAMAEKTTDMADLS
jgi:hypothetical protein